MTRGSDASDSSAHRKYMAIRTMIGLNVAKDLSAVQPEDIDAKGLFVDELYAAPKEANLYEGSGVTSPFIGGTYPAIVGSRLMRNVIDELSPFDSSQTTGPMKATLDKAAVARTRAIVSSFEGSYSVDSDVSDVIWAIGTGHAYGPGEKKAFVDKFAKSKTKRLVAFVKDLSARIAAYQDDDRTSTTQRMRAAQLEAVDLAHRQ